MTNPIRVGIIGASPDRWAARAHIPALKSLTSDFEVTALSTTRPESARAAGAQFGVSRVFSHHDALVHCDDVDVVVVAVKVPQHHELASAAIRAGKAVYCEWPLGNGLGEAADLAALAAEHRVLAVAGLQARFAPAVAYVHDLIEQGYVGQVLSTTLVGSGMGWGAKIDPANAYTYDKQNGATMLTIPFGHTLDALCYCLGEVTQVTATMTVRRGSFQVGDGDPHPMRVEDQLGVTGLLSSGAAFTAHYRGGSSRGTNLLWEINGTAGDLQIRAAGGHTQIFELDVLGGKDAQTSLEPLSIPEQYRTTVSGPAGNLARAYAQLARDYREGTRVCPTFEHAVIRHSMLDAMETASATGQRQLVRPPPPLPAPRGTHPA